MKLSHKIPITPWRAQNTWATRPRMVVPLFGGLAAFGVGEGLLVQSQWGASPWTVFAQGIAKHAQISLGWSTALISLVVLLVWFPLRQRLGFGTIANLIIIAYVLDLTTYAVAVPHAIWLKVVYVVGAVLCIGIGSAFYLTCNLGPGPRDGLMTGLHHRFHLSVVYIRLSLEVVVLTIGWLLGGTVGVATAFFATTIGFCIGASLNVMERTIVWWRT
ncbi:MAG TPA: hypothetical protein VMU68_12405 [Acidimicrobiales bacterium]|nr:hypothetical protein [Acidimicrobiales bacterium]